MITISSTLVMMVTIIAAFLIGVAASRKLVSGILHLMMLGRFKQAPAAPAVLAPAETR